LGSTSFFCEEARRGIKRFATSRIPHLHMRKFFAAIFTVVGLTSAALALNDHPARSQSGRAIRIILTVPPGGSIDLLARILADHISSTKGQSFVIESRPGAGGAIAAEAVARAPPDGSTVLINNNGVIINAILRKVNYNPLTSFESICYLVTTPQMIVVNSDSPYSSLTDLLNAARTRPAELSIASVGPNTTQHIGIERFKRLALANLTYIPYPGGGPVVNALLGAHVTSAVLNWSEIGEQLHAGKARALATMALRRIEPLPELPTVSESGYPDFETDVWFGVVAPAKTPQATISQLIDWFSAAVSAPEVRSKLTAQALYANLKCGTEFDTHIRHQSELYARLIRELGIKAE
jgi:tripartite-type tricarboxylate transporter receptor subunit TctC